MIKFSIQRSNRFSLAASVLVTATLVSLGSQTFFSGSGPAFAAGPETSLKKWRVSTIAGARAYKELRYGDAERSFKKAIEEAKKFGPDDLRLASSLSNLGVLYNFRGFFDKAEPLFEESVRIKEKKLGLANNDVISSQGKLCQFYLRRGKFDKAEPLANRVIAYGGKRVQDLKALKTKHKPDSKELRKELNQFLELAVLFDRMALASMGHSQNGRYRQSEELYKLSMQLRENALSGNHLALAESYENLGKLYLKEKRYKLAEPLLKKAYRTSKSTLGFANPKTYSKLDAWSQSLSGLGRSSQAESNYKLALQSFKEAYGANSGYVSNIETALAHTMANRGSYSAASVHLKRALAIQKRLRGPDHAITAAVRNEYIAMLRKARRNDEANRLKASSSTVDEI